MKKIITIALSFLIFLSSTSNNIYAFENLKNNSLPSHSNTTIIYQDNDIIVECTLTIWHSSPNIGTYSETKTRNSSKQINIKTDTGTVLATYVLTSTFNYDGSSSTCTRATCSTTVHNNNWNFTSATASKSGNQALGAYTLKKISTGATKSGSPTITCSKTGVIS